MRCGVQPGITGNVTPQDNTSLISGAAAHLDASNGPMSPHDEAALPFDNVPSIVLDHAYLPTRFGYLLDNSLVYISGWVVKKAMTKLSCNSCRSSLVTDDAPQEFSQHYHLLRLKNSGGLMIPSGGTVKVIRSAERCIRHLMKVDTASHHCHLDRVDHFVRADIGHEDIFELGQHIVDTQSGVDNHHYQLISLLVSLFYTLRQHHIAKVHTQKLQLDSTRKKLTKVILFKGH